MTSTRDSEAQVPLPAPTRLPVRALLLLVLVVLVWGASYPTMKAAALEIPIFTFRGWAALLPGLIMLIMARAAGHSISVPHGCRRGVILVAVFTVTLMHFLSTLSTMYMASGQTSLMLYTMPIWAFIIGIPVLGEKPTRAHWLGVVMGVGGIVLLWRQTAGGGLSPGVLIGLVSAISWGCGTIAVKSVAGRVPLLVMTGWTFLIGATPLCLLGLPELGQLGPVSPRALWSAIFVMLGANLVGFLAFFHIIKMVPATVASLSVLAVPGVAFGFGALLLDEAMTVMDVVAFGLIAGALTTVLPKPSMKRRSSSDH